MDKLSVKEQTRLYANAIKIRLLNDLSLEEIKNLYEKLVSKRRVING